MPRHFSRVGSVTDDFFRSWINAREEKLAQRDGVQVCAFEWGTEALAGIPGFASFADGARPELDVFRKANEWWLANSAAFFAHERPSDFVLCGGCLRFTSAVRSLYEENDTVYADYFQCRRAKGRAVCAQHGQNLVG